MNYWDNYYEGRAAPVLPSQFSVFVLGEFWPRTILDIGCGSGRDTLWFARQGIPTIGIDGSQAAIDLCSSRAVDISHVKFLRADIGDKDLAEMATQLCEGPTLVYARFFLHAISADDQGHFLDLSAQVLRAHGGILAVEYRTTRDADLSKETAAHFRRFIDPAELRADARRRAMTCRYAVEGVGYAKYKNDDAYVSRMIFTPE